MNVHLEKIIADSSSGCTIKISRELELSTLEEIEQAKRDFLASLPDNSQLSKGEDAQNGTA